MSIIQAAERALTALETIVIDVKTSPNAYEACRQSIAELRAALSKESKGPQMEITTEEYIELLLARLNRQQKRIDEMEELAIENNLLEDATNDYIREIVRLRRALEEITRIESLEDAEWNGSNGRLCSYRDMVSEAITIARNALYPE